MLAALSYSVRPPTVMRPDSGRARPAMTFRMVVFPAPERPKSAVTPPPAVKAASSAKAPTRQRTSRSSIAAGGAHVGATQQEFGSHQRRQGEQDRQEAQAQRLRVAPRHLRERIDGERQRLGFARDVGDESDGGTELAQAAGEGKQHAGENARKDERQGDAGKYPNGRRPEGGRGVFQATVDRIERLAYRAHQ